MGSLLNALLDPVLGHARRFAGAIRVLDVVDAGESHAVHPGGISGSSSPGAPALRDNHTTKRDPLDATLHPRPHPHSDPHAGPPSSAPPPAPLQCSPFIAEASLRLRRHHHHPVPGHVASRQPVSITASALPSMATSADRTASAGALSRETSLPPTNPADMSSNPVPILPAASADRQALGGVLASSLPADDGMQLLRKRIHEIREMPGSNEDKARRMHSIMTEKYNASLAHVLRPHSPASFVSQDRPFTPSSNHSRAHSDADARFASPASSALDPENPFNVLPADLVPSYWVRDPGLGASGFLLPEEELELEQEDEEQAFGCQHYKRNVKIQCYDCHRWYPCRHCHDEVETHNLNRRKTRHMLCMFCHTPQEASDYCRKCNGCAAWYYCAICKLWDDDSNNHIYHCDDCGICRKGEGLGKDFFHCKKCNVCINIKFADDHRCLEGATDRDCPICGDYLQTSTRQAVSLHCGHYLHGDCYNDYIKTAYKCPICKKSVLNMELQWRKLTHDIETQPMPPQFADTRVYIQCNDCSAKSSVKYHFLGNKCPTCDSYNTNELEFTAQPDMDQIVQATREMELAMSRGTLSGPRPVGSVEEPPRAARLRSGGSYFQPDPPEASARPGTAASALEHLLSPQEILQRFSRSLSPIRNYLNSSNDELWRSRQARTEGGNEEDDDDLDFWGSDGRMFLSGDEGGDDTSEDDSSSSDDSLDEAEDLEDDDDGDDEELDRFELIGHR